MDGRIADKPYLIDTAAGPPSKSRFDRHEEHVDPAARPRSSEPNYIAFSHASNPAGSTVTACFVPTAPADPPRTRAHNRTTQSYA